MSRLLPHPVLSVLLAGVWLLLNQSVSPGNILLGVVLGCAGGLALATLQFPEGHLRRPGVALRLALIVLADIVRSNIAVARLILSPRRKATAGFLPIPIDLRHPYGLAALACIITATPGTVWVNFDAAKGLLLIHVLDLVDERAWTHVIKDRYERPLMEIFE